MRAPLALVFALASFAGVARAANPFDTPLTPTLIDPRATVDWVDGHETARTDFFEPRYAPQWRNPVTWFVATTTTTPGHNGVTFGASPKPGPRHLRVGFTADVDVGTILTRGNIDGLSVLRAGAAYPGRVADDADWIEATRDSGDDLALWVLPPHTKTRALRFTTIGSPALESNAGRLLGVSVLSERFANVAPDATPLTSSHQEKAALLVDGSYQLWAAWDDDAEARTAPVSASRPEWIVLSWDRAVSLRGLCALWPGFGKADVQAFVGPAGLNPREAPDAAWRTLA
ncbi:MAG TPA: hypothetical protein VK989_04765, partial [Polyangia bacterium]|nr:hypothetical protein [Polyangia bacterium]